MAKAKTKVYVPPASIAALKPPPEAMADNPFGLKNQDFGVDIPRRMNESTFQRSIAAKRGYLKPRGFPKVKSRRLK